MPLPRCLVTVSALALMLIAARAEYSFDPILTNDALWTLDQDGFQKATKGLPLRWTSNVRDSARAAQPGMTLLGLPLTEIIVRFDQNKLTQITANIYARGDAGELSEAKFQALIVSARDAVTKSTAAKAVERGKDPTNAVKAEGIVWQTPKALYTLEYSFTKEVKSRSIPFRAEFIRLEIAAPQKTVGLLASAANLSRAKFSGPVHIKRDTAGGDVWVGDVPMVDQGQKGYCVVASTERVLRYYGNDVDENELAQIANSNSGGGTSLEAMREAMKKLTARLKIRTRELEKMEIRDILEMVKDYNRAAKRSGASPLPDPGRMIDVGEIYSEMKGDVLKDARTHNKASVDRFQRDVQAHIDQGVPLLWSVQLGLIQEAGLEQARGGHMRLIIGYNTKTQEILYSDSWGAGHELKRMKADDAWTMTTALMSIEPLS
jgi:hypothetical protein